MFELVRELAYMVAAKVTLNPHTQNRRMRHPKSPHEPVGHPPVSMVGGTIRRKLIHRESFRASALHHSDRHAVGKTLQGSFVP